MELVTIPTHKQLTRTPLEGIVDSTSQKSSYKETDRKEISQAEKGVKQGKVCVSYKRGETPGGETETLGKESKTKNLIPNGRQLTRTPNEEVLAESGDTNVDIACDSGDGEDRMEAEGCEEEEDKDDEEEEEKDSMKDEVIKRLDFESDESVREAKKETTGGDHEDMATNELSQSVDQAAEDEAVQVSGDGVGISSQQAVSQTPAPGDKSIPIQGMC